MYDQHCRFCTLWSGFLARRADHRLKLLAAQSAEGLADSRLVRAKHPIISTPGCSSTAPTPATTTMPCSRCCACCPGPWRHLRWLRLLPLWLRDGATRRYGATRWRAGSGRQRPPLRFVAPGVPRRVLTPLRAWLVAGCAACAPACGPTRHWP
ncbi:hypothetical protein ACPA9J_12970 [Pseudomonas aeruginosa]